MAKNQTDKIYQEQRYRDVHSDQQLNRGELQKPLSPTSRIVASVFAALVAFFVFYVLVSFFAFARFNVNKLRENAKNNREGTVEALPIFDSKIVHDENGQALGLRYVIDVNENGISDPEEELNYAYASHAQAKKVWSQIQKEKMENTELTEEERLEMEAEAKEREKTTLKYHTRPTTPHLMISGVGALFTFLITYQIMMRNLKAQNMLADTTDINQWANDAILQNSKQVLESYDIVPNAGYETSISASSIISHFAISNKGLKNVEQTQFHKKDVIVDGEVEHYKGEIKYDSNNEIVTKTVPVFDTKLMETVFDKSELPNRKDLRIYHDPTRIKYNPGGEIFDKAKYERLMHLINNDWTLPYYEPQRASGVYVVDTAPVNTMLLAITRAGKGQMIIKPSLDIWTREKTKHNIVINDPKGELLTDFYVRGTVRGYTIVQFNLMNVIKTDIYNPLGLAAEAARDGNFKDTAMYVENIANVFFPLEGGDDPVWPTAANNAFKRAAYGLIDYYLEEEKILRLQAERVGMDPQVLETQLDKMWGKVTLYNAYQLFVQLTSKKLKNPLHDFKRMQESDAFDGMTDDEVEAIYNEAVKKSVVWEDRPEQDLLTLYFNATRHLPRNTMRTMTINVDDSLRSMAGAEKMMSSVYGIAITAMSFFTDPTISTLTSGTPSQNVDLAGLSFPRRFGVRFHSSYIKMYRLAGLQVKWDAFDDDKFEKNLGKDFEHTDLIGWEGWAKYYFKGIFPNDKAYIRLRLFNPETGMLVRSFYFEFKKGYQTSLDGTYYLKDPILDEKIVKDGILTELRQFKHKKTGETVYRPARTTFKDLRVTGIIEGDIKSEKADVNAITRIKVGYVEKPKMVFLVTPPHLMKYAKLILVLIKQLLDLSFGQSYMTKEDQKPLYKTRYMLDELGNLQSEGHGIENFSTLLSIGLGQDQQFTLVLQTLQQLRDVYGDSVDKIVQGNAQPLWAKIATPNGYKAMSEMQIGDKVCTPEGKESSVIGVYPQGVRKLYRVTLADGSVTYACDEHLWAVKAS